MTYADTDFFLALLKDKDWLKSAARRLLPRHRDQLWTSLTTILELLLLATRFRLDPERIVVDTVQLAELRGIDVHTVLLAAHFIKRKRVTTFDAIHAASCVHAGDSILSSDNVYDRLGLTRISLER